MQVDAQQRETSRLKPFALLYGQFLARNGAPPKHENELKQFVGEHGGTILARAQLSIDELFVSERDGLPFVVIYGNQNDPTGRLPIAHEAEGVGGRRLFAFPLGMVAELDEAEFQALVEDNSELGQPE